MRNKRSKQVRNTINKEWCNHYFKFILDNPDKPWNWKRISRNPNITWEIITDNPDKPWDWSNISQNPNINMEIIRTNPEKPWDWYLISRNPNITMEIILENPNKPWNWRAISCNPFTKEKEQFITRKQREHMAAYKIQQWCLSIIISPHYKIGRRLIDKKYKELFDS